MPCGGNSFRNCLRLEKCLLCLPNLFIPVLVSFPSKHQKQPKDDFVKSVAGHPVFSIDTKYPLCNGPAKELWQSWIVFQHWSKIFKQISFLSYNNILHVWMGSGHYSDSPLLRRPIILTAHCSDSPFLRQPIIPSKMVKSSIIILKSVVFLLYLTEDWL